MTQPFFRAPAFDEPEHCHCCGIEILPGEIIAEWSDSPYEYIHEPCLESMRDDAAEQSAEWRAA